jgi:hypothetical protein
MVAGWLEAGVKKSEQDEFASSSAASGLFIAVMPSSTLTSGLS